MKNIHKFLYMFTCGFFDSISLYWVRKILLVTHPTNKKIHPSSLELLSTFKNTFIQVFVFLIGLPYLCRYFNQQLLAVIVSTFFLLLTYGYLFFYNTQVMTSTKKVALWSTKFPNTNFCQFDNREKAQLFYSLSNQVKSFVFLILYYTPIFIACIVVTSYFPFIGTIMIMISQSFFNATFYFLKKWPYDRFNVAFMEKNIAYMMGYGFFVSFVCNVCLNGDFSRGAYFVLSQWMIINCLLFSPPQKQFKSFSQVWNCVTSSQARSKLPNAYNIHRNKIRKDKNYRQELLKSIVYLKPALKITQYLNSLLANYFSQNLGFDNGSSITEMSTTSQLSKQTQATTNSTQKDVQISQKPGLTVVSETYQPEQ